MNLLTLDEKKFLSYLNFNYIKKFSDCILFTYSDEDWDGYCLYYHALKLKFKGLELNKQYSRKELEL